MTPHQQQEHHPSRPRSNIVLLAFLGIAGFYLVTEHTAHQEEREALAEFGEAYARYVATTPAFFPRFGAAASREAER